VLACAERGDTEEQAERLLERVLNYRVFSDAEGRMNRSLRDVQGGLLLVPQFTLGADTRKGNRPSFTEAARPEEAEPLVERFVETLRALGIQVETGVFGAKMQVELVNDGPVTIILDL
jgi:D-tyrosyl-tRNA(Tyr) deacylase